MKILIIGTGYVGTTTGLIFCKMGHQVTGLDLDMKKINALQAGKLHFYEPGLEHLLSRHVKAGNILLPIIQKWQLKKMMLFSFASELRRTRMAARTSPLSKM